MEVLVTIAQYYLDDKSLKQSLAALNSLFAASNMRMVPRIFDMRSTVTQIDIAASEQRLPYPFFDMSAYQQGVQHAGEYELAVFLNDTLFVKHPWKLMATKLLALMPLVEALPVPCAAGAVHPSTDILMVDQHNLTRKHLSTFLFATNRQGTEHFRQLTEALSNPEDELGRSWLRTQSKRHPGLAVLLQIHLGKTGNPWSWHGMAVHSNSTLLHRKSITVALEYLFTQRLLAAGGCVLPINIGIGFKLKTLVSRLINR